MKITIVSEFDSVPAAAAFLARVAGEEKVVEGEVLETKDTKDTTRKPRSDAGKARGPNARTTGSTEANPAGAGAQTGNPGGAPASSAAAPAGEASPVTAAASTPPQGAASTASSNAAPSSSASAAQSASAPNKPADPAPSATEEFPATLDGARKAMKKLNDTPSKGMDACIAALKAHGVNRISDLPKEKYADFIKYVLDQVPAAK